MGAVPDVEDKAARIAALMEERLGIKGAGLEAKLRRAGRLLPRWVRREAGIVAEALRHAGNPKLMKRIDPAAVSRAAAKCERWLASVDPAELRKDRLLSLLAVNAINLLVLAAAILGALAWMGRL